MQTKIPQTDSLQKSLISSAHEHEPPEQQSVSDYSERAASQRRNTGKGCFVGLLQLERLHSYDCVRQGGMFTLQARVPSLSSAFSSSSDTLQADLPDQSSLVFPDSAASI
ncbi:hypothetical protein HBI42_218810 [Parastagonospora nodorum]|nr:hypothetical protein HBI43_216360 [Parastagonospora nodorum]KAH6243382.1 hypothetical protein HBI42_218810 [Parastagonospora nodorum]